MRSQNRYSNKVVLFFILPVLLIFLFSTPAVAGYEEGLAAVNREDYATALREFKPLADQGDASGQNGLGWLYRTGNGVPQDFKIAFELYTLSAKQGLAKAQYNLGLMYANGKGVVQDYNAALKWFKLAAEQGYDKAQYYLGWMYDEGQGVTQDFKTAFNWTKLAAEQGDADAQGNLGGMYTVGQGVAQDFKAGFKWFKLAAGQGNAPAQFMLGIMYGSGEGVVQDETKAVAWYRKAAEQGFPSAQHELSRMYYGGWGTPQDKVQAYVWVSLAAARRYKSSKKIVNSLASDMTSEQLIEAQRIAWEWEKTHASPLSVINFEPKSSFVVIDQSASALTVFTGISKESSDQEIDAINSRISEQEKTVIVSWSEFIKNVRNFTNSAIIKHEYMEYGVVDGIVCLVGNAPGTPWGLTWNGGIALTSNDYRHAKDIYQLHERDPSKYEQEANRDPRADPINPGGFLPAYGCI